jgi:hypothetical protein
MKVIDVKAALAVRANGSSRRASAAFRLSEVLVTT